jgi:hypothetical protein
MARRRQHGYDAAMKPSLSGIVIGIAATAAAFVTHDSLHAWGNVYTRALVAGCAAAAVTAVLGVLTGAFRKS